MANKWITHIKKTMRRMKSKGTYAKGKGLKQVILEAKKTWAKVKKGGAESESDSEDAPVDKEKEVKVESSMGTTGLQGVMGGRKRKTRRRVSRRR